MSQSFTLRNTKGSALTHAELDNNFNNQLGTVANVRFNSFGVGVAESGTAGTILASSNITAYSSDERLKTNFKPIQDAIKKLMSISGYEFDWDEQKCAELEFNFANKHEHGVKAQEIQKVIPDAVSPAPFDRADDGSSASGENYLTVDYARIVPLLIEAVKAQQVQIEALEAKLATLVE